MWNETCLILNLIFQHYYPLKLAEIIVKCEIEMRPAPPHLSWLLDTDLNSKLCWPQSANQYIYIWAYRLHLITNYLQQSGTIYTIIYLTSRNRNTLMLNSVNLTILGQVAKLNSVYNFNLKGNQTLITFIYSIRQVK